MSQLDPIQLGAVSARASQTIRALTEKIASLTTDLTQANEKIASMEREKKIELLATEMEEKGLSANLSFEEKVAHLKKYPDLDRVEEAVKLAASGIPIAKMTEDRPGEGVQDSLTSWCLGGE